MISPNLELAKKRMLESNYKKHFPEKKTPPAHLHLSCDWPLYSWILADYTYVASPVDYLRASEMGVFSRKTDFRHRGFSADL